MSIVPPSRKELCDELARLLASKTFAASQRSRQLLQYLVNQLLLGTADQVKEYTIGVDVFDRPSGYDPQLDTIARTETWRLRSKLSVFYAAEGKDNPLRIGFRPRSMVPIAEYRTGDSPWVTRLNAVSSLRRIAVLPFVSIGYKDETFNEGLATDLIVHLGACGDLQVISRSSSFDIRGQGSGLSEIADRLKADLLVEGTVQMRERELRVTVLLTNTASGLLVHSATYDLKTAPSLGTQQDLAQQIATDIRGVLMQQAGETVGGVRQGDYLDSLMRMRFQFSHQAGATAGLAQSIKYFQAAAQAQPGNQSIRRALSISVGNLMSLGGPSEPGLMSRLLMQAVPESDHEEMVLEARVCAGMVAMFRGEYQSAAQTLVRTTELHPNASMAHVALGILLLHTGRLEEALQAMLVGQTLDPLSTLNAGMLATVLFSLRRYEAAREQAALCLAFDQKNMMAHALLADIDLVSGRHDAALSQSFDFCRLSNGHPLALGKLGYIFGLQGQRAKVHNILNSLLAQADEPGRVAPSIALTYLGLGDTGKALQWMLTAAEHKPFVDIVPSLPFYDALRSDPKFNAMTPRLG